MQSLKTCIVTDEQVLDYSLINTAYQVLRHAGCLEFLINRVSDFISMYMQGFMQPLSHTRDAQSFYQLLSQRVNVQLPNIILILIQIF